MKNRLAVAIDGPSGAGKSTIAKLLAKELGFLYVDTGALYRAIGYEVIKKGGRPDDEEFVTGLLPDLNVELKYGLGDQLVFINGCDVSDLIRSPEVSMAASAVSAMPEVRRFLFNLQRETALKNDVIMDGRDIGTVVLPDAEIKIFLTASVEDRARRRFAELTQKSIETSYADVLDDMKKRDYNDSHRKTAPLKAAHDAIKVDTTGNTLEQSVNILKQLVLDLMSDNKEK